MDFKDVLEQGVLDSLQLTERASMGCLLLLAEERQERRINFGDLLCCPLGKICNTYVEFMSSAAFLSNFSLSHRCLAASRMPYFLHAV
jgi:hypothetical protein